MIDDLKKVSIRPGVSLLSVLPHLNYKPWYALAEFVDNAIQSYETNRVALRKQEGKTWTLDIDIDIDNNRNVITVRDNAAGISREAYGRAFRPAEAPLDASGLSEFGMGMKSAAAWLSPRWTIRTSALGEKVERTVSFDIASIVANTIEELIVVSVAAPPEVHFTEIILSDIRLVPRKRTLSKIKDHLSSLYRTFLARGDVSITLNGDRLFYEQPEILVAPSWRNIEGKPMKWHLPVKFALEGGRRVEGWVALRAKGSTTRAGFALLRRGRVIEGSGDEPYRPRELFGTSNSFVYQRLFGELTLVGFNVSHTKDGIRWDESEDEMISQLKTLLAGDKLSILEQAQNWRSGENDKVLAEIVPLHSKIEAPTAARLAKAKSEPRIVTRDQVEEVDGNVTRRMTMPLGDDSWDVDVTFNASVTASGANWLEITAPPKLDLDDRRLSVSLSLNHPFSVSFMGSIDNINEGVLRLAIGLAISEAIAQADGVRHSGRIRRSLNELLLIGLADAD